MASAELTTLVLENLMGTLTFLLPVIGVMAVANWVITIVLRVTMGAPRDIKF